MVLEIALDGVAEVSAWAAGVIAHAPLIASAIVAKPVIAFLTVIVFPFVPQHLYCGDWRYIHPIITNKESQLTK